MLRKLLLALLVLVALLALGAVAAVKGLTTRLETPYRGAGSAAVFVDVEPGDSTRVIARRLTRAGVVPDAWTFRLAVWQSGSAQSLQAGEYEFPAALSPLQVVDKIAQGDVVLRTITFPEGLTIKEMAEVFDQSAFGSGDEFLAQAGRAELVRDLDAEALNLEARDVELDDANPTLRVRRGKGGRSRLVPVHPELAAALRLRLDYGGPRDANAKLIGVGRQQGSRWITQGVKRAVDAGMLAPGRRVTSHTLRHSYARHLLTNGIPLNVLSRWMGHSNLDSTLIYLAILPDPTGSLAAIP